MGSDAGFEPLCGTDETTLAVVTYGDTERYYVPVALDGERVLFELDTGSGLTFVYLGRGGMDYVPAAAELEFGCDTFTIAGRGFDPGVGTVAGVRVAGIVGMDALWRHVTALDVGRRTLTQLARLPAAAESADFVPVDIVLDHALARVTIDDEPLRLLFDTFAGHTLLVGHEGRPGDREQSVVDAEGTVFTIFVGTGSLRYGERPAHDVPVARALRFPYFEETVAALGGDIDGLLGVTAFPEATLVFDRRPPGFYVLAADSM